MGMETAGKYQWLDLVPSMNLLNWVIWAVENVKRSWRFCRKGEDRIAVLGVRARGELEVG